ncbi:uncharacterized protein CTRU02_207345 [Colletotrichum truncatum]|uniref:Uncharacterized protein n=1 Tax=Colletotrichum truncatum TaxID=5467 RepID=A0ACC3Z0J3_COLTU|nr:uncharacterized protein CTRU02_01019 [Colletotrichum truncatum]KAF6800614.1 hypothetical protein CTRU02_01019 [Colletotrichum truncatum]
MASVINNEEQNNLTAFVRRTASNKTIRAEVFAVNALHNPASATNVLIAPQSVEAFHYVQSFKRVESTPTVNLHEIFPVLRAFSQPENQLTLFACPEQIVSQYKKLDAAKKLLISRLNNLPAGIAFIPGVAGSGKTELIKFIVAACMFGQGTAIPVPTLYLAPNNQAVDDMAKKLQEYFQKLDLEGSPTIMRLYNLDFEVKSVIRVLAPGPVNSYQYFDKRKAQDVIQAMDSDAEKQDPTDRAYQFLAIYQFEKMGLEMNEKNENSRSKRTRSTNICADTAAVAYYKDHIDKYRDLRDILTISDRDGKLSDDLLKEARLLVKNVFHDMLADFKGIICTTSVVSASATVKRFSAEMLFIDEAARQSELSSLISFAHYQPRAWFFLGDTAQLKPYVGQDSKRTDNPFIRQMSVSLLERAVLAGVELGWLDVTHRLRGNLRQVSSKINYGNRMKTISRTDWNWSPSTVAFSEEMKRLVGESLVIDDPSRVVLQFPFAQATLAGSSSMNITHVRWVVSQVKKMLKNPQLQNVDSTKMANFLILPLYKAQVDLYRKTLLDERIQGSISGEDYRRIEVRTLDSSQGEERDLVIVDYVQTHKAGFCVDPNRNCLATTRAQQCEILIINAGMINSPRLENSKPGQIIAAVRRLGCVLKIPSCTNCEDPSHNDDDCPVTVKSCNWCKEIGHSRANCPKVQCTNCRELGHIEPNCKVPKLCQQCGEVATTDHHKVCLGMKICSVCWKCHTGDPCEICFHCRGKGHKASACFHNPASNKTAKTRAINCNCCGELGHKAGDCPNKPARACHSCALKTMSTRTVPHRNANDVNNWAT